MQNAHKIPCACAWNNLWFIIETSHDTLYITFYSIFILHFIQLWSYIFDNNTIATSKHMHSEIMNIKNQQQTKTYKNMLEKYESSTRKKERNKRIPQHLQQTNKNHFQTENAKQQKRHISRTKVRNTDIQKYGRPFFSDVYFVLFFYISVLSCCCLSINIKWKIHFSHIILKTFDFFSFFFFIFKAKFFECPNETFLS